MRELVETLHDQGYAIVRGLLDPTTVHGVRRAFDRLLAIATTLDGTTDIDGTRFVVSTDPFRLRRVVWAGGCEPALDALGADPRFTRVAAAALGTEPVVQIIQQAHYKLPGDGVDFAPHQDASNRRYGSALWNDVDGRGSFVQIALAVDPMDADNGALKVMPGSHRLGFVADPETGRLPDGVWDPSAAVDLRLEPGDAAVFGPFLLHGSPENRGSSARRLFLQGYAPVGANHRVYPGCGTGVLRAID